MHPQMIKCFMVLLNGFKKNQGHLLHSEKNIIYSRLQRLVILKKTTYNFLAEKTSVERDGVPWPMD